MTGRPGPRFPRAQVAYRLVELRGFEPLTPSMPWKCATNCATAPSTALWAVRTVRLAGSGSSTCRGVRVDPVVAGVGQAKGFPGGGCRADRGENADRGMDQATLGRLTHYLRS